MQNKTISRQAAVNMIMGEVTHSGLFFSVKFTKKNGLTRNMNCRSGVRAHLVGGETTWEPRDHKMVTVWDAKNRGYRTVNAATVESFRHRGDTYAIVD